MALAEHYFRMCIDECHNQLQSPELQALQSHYCKGADGQRKLSAKYPAKVAFFKAMETK